MNKDLIIKLLQYANSGDSDQAASDAMRKAALKIEYLTELSEAIVMRKDEGDFKSTLVTIKDVRGEDWYDARERALKAGQSVILHNK
jgi:hypothetical protein